MNVLCVDDSRVMRRMLGDAARTIGFDILEAGTGQEALDRLEHATDVAAITLDINMPDMTGIECLEHLKADVRFANIPVIMVSSAGHATTILQAIRLGARHYITKPFTIADVTSRLLEVIDDDFDTP